ncbi:APC family permease [Mycolicibacterium brisbanense]|uniref:Amino acid/metabolite permease n=1 Tax=Mycolicibacterium brisbanense TaxID=146020 RepID=A0A100VTY3_9MYCO|nr:amino acid permease [Mycolicibacterium brisbanense]MCV7160472.1 amino acid permease [Mycolicibacterium brisbanense]GAS85930.1 amino acid/metabolite permease [Mycolicibacterium brisbanense]
MTLEDNALPTPRAAVGGHQHAADDAQHLEKFGYKQELNRALGLFSSFGVQFTSISVGSVLFTTIIVGFGFFGPASFWPFIIGGALQVFGVGLAVAQLVSAFPLSGGVYQIISRLAPKAQWLAWQGGWWLVIAHTVAVGALAVSMVPFIAGWFGIDDLSAGQVTLWAIGIIVLVTLVNIAGVRAAAVLNNVGVVAEAAIIIMVIVGLVVAHYDRAPASVLFDTAGTTADRPAWIAFLFGMILPAYAISSFDATGNAAEETKNAARNAALGTVLANTAAVIGGAVFFYLLVRAIPNVDAVMASATPVKLILDSTVGTTVTTIFEAVAIVALMACIAMLQLTAVRVIWSQARDRQMPAARWLHKLNGNRIPMNATFVVTLISIMVCCWSSLLTVLSAMTALAWALAYGVVVIVGFNAVIRKRLPEHPFNLKAASPIVFLVAIVWSVVLCALLVWSDWLRVGVGMLVAIGIGFLIYFTIPSADRGNLQREGIHD